MPSRDKQSNSKIGEAFRRAAGAQEPDMTRLLESVPDLMADARRRRAREEAQANVLDQVGRWWKPVIAAGALISAVFLATLGRVGAADPSAREDAVATALGIPGPVAEWMRSDRVPTQAEMLYSW